LHSFVSVSFDSRTNPFCHLDLLSRSALDTIVRIIGSLEANREGKGSFTEKKNFLVVVVVACHCAAIVSGNAVGEEVAEAWRQLGGDGRGSGDAVKTGDGVGGLPAAAAPL